MNFTKSDIESIKKSIEEAEKKTSGEIVPMVLSQSDNYLYTHYLSSLIFTFLGLILLENDLLSLDISSVLIVFMFTFIGYFIPLLNPIKRALLLKKEINEEVEQKALQSFYTNKLHLTRDKTGVLIYISILERKINILGDAGINEKVDQAFWDEEVSILAHAIKSNNITSGLNEVIGRIGEKLSEHFPLREDDTNELKNELITDLKIL